MERETGATIVAVGKYYPNRSMATEREPPLALDVLAMEEDQLKAALQRIQQIAEQGPPNLSISTATTVTVKSPITAKVFMPGLDEDPLPPSLNIYSIRGKILGPQVKPSQTSDYHSSDI